MTRIFFSIAALLFAFAAHAQALSPAQQTTLRAGICADTTTARPMMLAGDANSLNAWLNTPSAYIVWRTRVTRDDVTGDGFDWTQVDNLTAGQARIWELIFATQTGAISFADAGKRAGITEAWKGTAAKVAVATFVLAAAKRPATNAERILAAGTGSQAVPGVMVFEGDLSPQATTGLVYNDNGSLKGC